MPIPANEWHVTELLKRCSSRPADEIAWEEFVRRFHSTIKSNVYRTFHRKARNEADRKPQLVDDVVDDLVQSVYFRLVEDRCRAIKRFEGSHANSIYPYLAMISINVVRDYFREMKAQKRPRISYSLDELLETSGDAALFGERVNPSDTIAVEQHRAAFTAEEIEKALRRAVGKRKRERDMLIFKLHYYEGLTAEEIIRVMGLDLTSIGVTSILNRIVKKMRSYLLRH